MKTISVFKSAFVIGVAGFIAACGGGGGAAPAVAPPVTKLAAILPPAGFSFANFQSSKLLLSTDLVFNAGDFVDKALSYVSIWYVGSDGNRQQVAFMTLQALQAMDANGGFKLQVPGYITALAYEIYDNDSTATGGLTL